MQHGIEGGFHFGTTRERLPRSTTHSLSSPPPAFRKRSSSKPANLKIGLARVRVAPVKLARARQFIEAVAAQDLEAAEELLDPDVETVTPRGTLRGIAACRQVLQKASGDEQFAMEQAEPEFEDIEGDVIARTQEIARWRETGEVAYERDFAVRLTLDEERIVRIVVMPGARRPRSSIVHRTSARRLTCARPSRGLPSAGSRGHGGLTIARFASYLRIEEREVEAGGLN